MDKKICSNGRRTLTTNFVFAHASINSVAENASLSNNHTVGLPSVLLFGRTNVGKSTLFNRLSKSKSAIVDNQPGVTRDFLTATIEQRFQIIDSGGLFSPADDFSHSMEARVRNKLQKADVVVWVVDGRSGLTPTDQTLAQSLRILPKPCIVAVNKMDTERDEEEFASFYRLGMQIVLPVSAEHNLYIDALKEAILQALPSQKETPSELPVTATFALVGRPNVGKSSLTNALLKEDRVLVSSIAGTTRDAVECPFTWHFHSGQTAHFVLIDTAGVRKKPSDSIEFYTSVRTRAALAKTNLSVLLLDALTGPTALDKTLLQEIQTLGKGCILVVNKWDLAQKSFSQNRKNLKNFQQSFATELRRVCPLTDAPIVFLSAETGEGLETLLQEIQTLQQRLNTHFTTGVLNRCLQNLQQQHPPTSYHGKHFKLYYAVQIDRAPITLKAFCNQYRWMPPTYEKFLENGLRKTFSLSGCPIRWEWVEKQAERS